jgi:hypothetical protein
MMNKVVNKFVNNGRITQTRIQLESLASEQVQPESIVNVNNRAVRNPLLELPRRPVASAQKQAPATCLNDLFEQMIEQEPQFGEASKSI